MNFTKEYIKECDCEEIQGLRKKLEVGDYMCDRLINYGFDKKYIKSIINIAIKINKEENKIETNSIDNIGSGYGNLDRIKEGFIWLPTGDQLDEEIILITVSNFDNYAFKHIYSEAKRKYLWDVYIIGECAITYSFVDANPLIAKIKLLKELLNEKQKSISKR